MIFRKPYALFIKYFRLLHGILTFLIFLLFFCSISLYRFFRIYSTDFRSALTDYSVSNYLNFLTFIELFFVIVIFVILLVVMFYKDKPKNVYIFGLITFIFVFIFYYLSYSTMKGLNYSEILSIKVSKAYRDFAMIAAILQFVNFGFSLVRAIGFDIKKFDFSSDLQSLDISSKDNEEIEVAIDFDKNIYIRRFRHFIRYFKYYYFEHRFIINAFGLILIISFFSIIYFSSKRYYENYNQGQSFSVNSISMNVQETFVLDSNPNGIKIVSDYSDNPGVIVLVRFQVKGFGLKQKFNSGLVLLKIGDYIYRPNLDYALECYDIGEAYVDQILTDEYETYLMAFEIPSKFVKKKMQLRINDSNSFVGGNVGVKNYYVNLEPRDLRRNSDEGEYKIGDNVSFGESILSSSYLKIDSYEINNKFKLDYRYCYRDDKCINSYEYLSPTSTGNYFKTLLKISGKFSIDKKLNISGINNLLYFLNNFGYIHYKVNGEIVSKKISSEYVKPNFAKTLDYFIEVPYDVKDSDELFLMFNIRGKIYKYVLK